MQEGGGFGPRFLSPLGGSYVPNFFRLFPFFSLHTARAANSQENCPLLEYSQPQNRPQLWTGITAP